MQANSGLNNLSFGLACNNISKLRRVQRIRASIDLETYLIQLPEELTGSFTLSIQVKDTEGRFNCFDVACTIAD
jgi:hypothetical protein